MVVSFRSLSLPSCACILAAIGALIVLGGAPSADAQGTHLWTQSRFEEFEKGTPDGVAIGSDGHLHEGPALREMLTTPSTFVWSVAADKNGTAYLGTGSPATVLRVGKDGKPFTLFESKDLSVQVVRLGPDGALYAATLPSGKIYKLEAASAAKIDEQKATVVFDASKLDSATRGPDGTKASGAGSDGKADETASADRTDSKSHYIWDMTFDPAGRLYVATGGPAAVYRVDPAKLPEKPEEFFKSDEQHIRSLAWDAKGNLIAGSDGSGLVYRINSEGKGFVLFEAPRREITSVSVGADGTIYAASVGDKGHNPLPPLPVQGIGSITITIVQPGSLQAANASASVPEGTDIYALSDGQAARRLWSSKDDIVYALAAGPDGLLALSGNRGHIFRIQQNGDYADVAHLEAQQGLSLAHGTGSELLIGTGNTGKLFTLGAAEKHEYASDVLDAGAMARYGRIEVEPGSGGYALWTRSGNVEQPVRGWSDWETLKDGVAVSPAGRFLQWKAVLSRDGILGSVGVNYLPVNAAPVVDDVVVVPGARLNVQNQATNQQTVSIALPSASQGTTVSFDAGASGPLQAAKDRTAIAVRWAAHDDNSDDLSYSLFLRGDGEHVWRLLKEDLTDKAYSFDATLIPDGGYQVKVVASDAPSHTPGEALTGEKVSDRFEVDTTAPVVRALAAVEETAQCAQAKCSKAVSVTFEAEDAFSPIAHAEYSLDAGPWKYIAPVGELSDSKHEHYEFRVPASAFDGKAAEHLLTVRVYDRYENVGVAKTVFDTTGK
jgi:WD40 repeat protein